MTTIDTDVLVIGAGPTGLSAALFLARQGLRCHLVEKRSGPQRAPAAHVVNARSFEIWRQAGVDMTAVFALAKDPRDAGMVHWVTRLGGEVLGSLPFERQGEEALAATPTPLRNLSQHRLEPLLAREVVRAGGDGPHYSIRWERSVEDSTGVTSLLTDLTRSEGYEVRSRYVIAADGAGSPVRKSLGIACEGPDRLQSFLMVHFEANLRAAVGAHPGVIYWMSDPASPGCFVAHDIDREWVFMHPWDAGSEPLDGFDDARSEALVRAAMTGAASDVPIAIRTVGPWLMTSQVAERYREGRIFLAGDAAHRFPPTGGLGLNTGVQDAHNLVWKIAAVERGEAGAGLLETYESERRPVAAYNAEQSLANAMRIMEVPMAMGTADEPAAAARNFVAMLGDAGRRAEVAAAIANQATHFDMPGLQLGYRYTSAAIVDDGSAAPAPADPVRDFVASAKPGSRLPHGWIAAGGRRLSTLDLVADTGFTLFVRDAAAWRDVAEALRLRVVEWRGIDDESRWWSGIAGLGDDGVLLVRPDQHVAARFSAKPAPAELVAAVARANGKP